MREQNGDWQRRGACPVPRFAASQLSARYAWAAEKEVGVGVGGKGKKNQGVRHSMSLLFPFGQNTEH